jgi:hypothetical protein
LLKQLRPDKISERKIRGLDVSWGDNLVPVVETRRQCRVFSFHQGEGQRDHSGGRRVMGPTQTHSLKHINLVLILRGIMGQIINFAYFI